MDVLDPGHRYLLPVRPFDKVAPQVEASQEIAFVKRKCETNDHADQHDGIITQDLFRVALDRTEYLYAEQPCIETRLAGWCIRTAWWLYEKRAYVRHAKRMDGMNARHPLLRLVPFAPWNIEKQPVNHEGHVAQ